MPFFGLCPRVNLDYGKRVENRTEDHLTDYFKGSADEMAASILHSLQAVDAIIELQNPYTADKFLQDYMYRAYNDLEKSSVSIVFELGMAAAVCGDFDFAERCLNAGKFGNERDRIMWPDAKATQDEFSDHLEKCVQALKISGAQLQAHLRQTAHDNAVKLGFRPAPLEVR